MSDEEDRDEPEPPPTRGPREASEKQLGFVRALQRKLGLDDEALADVADEVAGVRELEELKVNEASELIDELQTRAREKGVDLSQQAKISEKQVGFVKTLKRRAHMTDAEFGAFLQEHAGTAELEEVGRRDASAVIDALLALTKSGGGKPAASAAPPPPSRPAPPLDPAGDDDVPF
ncbi:MAG: hypothetical protein KDD82_02530 [Planctomycetes bacterium]|nr:hypothetical protein [Planctomycetota bacterium]